MLTDKYNEINKDDHVFEIIFISLDDKQEDAEKQFDKMPWTMIHFDNQILRAELCSEFNFESVPHLVLIDTNGMIIHDGKTALFANTNELISQSIQQNNGNHASTNNPEVIELYNGSEVNEEDVELAFLDVSDTPHNNTVLPIQSTAETKPIPPHHTDSHITTILQQSQLQEEVVSTNSMEEDNILSAEWCITLLDDQLLTNGGLAATSEILHQKKLIAIYGIDAQHANVSTDLIVLFVVLFILLLLFFFSLFNIDNSG